MRYSILLILLLLPVLTAAPASTGWLLRVEQVHGSPVPVSVTLSYKARTCVGKVIERSSRITLRGGWLRVSVTPSTLWYRVKVCLSDPGRVDHWELNGRALKGRCVDIEVARDGEIVASNAVITIYLKGGRRSSGIIEASEIKASKTGANGSEAGSRPTLARVTVTKEGGGWISERGSFLYEAGNPVVVEARDNLSSGDIFYTWRVNNVTLSDNPLRILANGSLRIVAIFKKVTELANGSDIDVWGGC